MQPSLLKCHSSAKCYPSVEHERYVSLGGPHPSLSLPPLFAKGQLEERERPEGVRDKHQALLKCCRTEVYHSSSRPSLLDGLLNRASLHPDNTASWLLPCQTPSWAQPHIAFLRRQCKGNWGCNVEQSRAEQSRERGLLPGGWSSRVGWKPFL